MTKVNKRIAEKMANKLNGKKLLEISKKAVIISNIPKYIKIAGWDMLFVEKVLVECSTNLESTIKLYENKGYKITTNRKDYDVGIGEVLMCNKNFTYVCLGSNFVRFKSAIERIDTYLNVINGNLEATGKHRCKRIRSKSRDNRLTKTFNKLLRDTIVEDYPEVVI